jgi:uncharacterized protein YndB with AHSA1/START domain
MTREFDAPAERVYQACMDPELFAQWIGPHDLTTRIDAWDGRTGGHWHFTNLRGTEEFGFFGSFHEVRPNVRIVQTFTWEGMPDEVALDTIDFEDLGDGRCRIHAVSRAGSFEARDGMLASGMDKGVREGYEKLDALLAGQQVGQSSAR